MQQVEEEKFPFNLLHISLSNSNIVTWLNVERKRRNFFKKGSLDPVKNLVNDFVRDKVEVCFVKQNYQF
jgi:hypothetical protein